MSVTPLLLSLTLISGFLLSQVQPAQEPQNGIAPVKLRFCYEDKQLLPYYAGNSAAVPDNPGATIEHLRRATAEAGISLELVRMPWLRCLQELEHNNVDALVAAYDESRAHFTRYPTRADGSPDPDRAINQLGLCLAYRYDNGLPKK